MSLLSPGVIQQHLIQLSSGMGHSVMVYTVSFTGDGSTSESHKDAQSDQAPSEIMKDALVRIILGSKRY